MFEEEIDKEEFDDDFDWGPLEDAWVKKVLNRHYRFVGIRRYTGRDLDGKWFKSLHLQIYKWYDKELFRWNTKKGLW